MVCQCGPTGGGRQHNSVSQSTITKEQKDSAFSVGLLTVADESTLVGHKQTVCPFGTMTLTINHTWAYNVYRPALLSAPAASTVSVKMGFPGQNKLCYGTVKNNTKLERGTVSREGGLTHSTSVLRLGFV